MRAFTPGKVIKRVVKIKSSDRAIADAQWIVAMDETGVRIKRFGSHGEGSMHLSWRSVIGHALIHRAGYRPPVAAGDPTAVLRSALRARRRAEVEA